MNLPEDPFIRELLPEFIDDWIQNMGEQYLPALQSKNSEELYRVGHTLKGSCFQFGLDDVAELGIKLMGHSKLGEWEQATELYSIIKNQFETVKKELEQISAE